MTPMTCNTGYWAGAAGGGACEPSDGFDGDLSAYTIVDLKSPSAAPPSIVGGELVQATEVSAHFVVYTDCTPVDDVDVVATIPRAGVGGSSIGAVGVIARCDGDDTAYATWHDMNGNNDYLSEVTNGSFSTIDTDPINATYPQDCAITCNGTTIKSYHDVGGGWVEQCTGVDATLTEGNAGLHLDTQGAGPPTGSTVYLDDFAVAALGGLV